MTLSFELKNQRNYSAYWTRTAHGWVHTALGREDRNGINQQGEE